MWISVRVRRYTNELVTQTNVLIGITGAHDASVTDYPFSPRRNHRRDDETTSGRPGRPAGPGRGRGRQRAFSPSLCSCTSSTACWWGPRLDLCASASSSTRTCGRFGLLNAPSPSVAT